MELAAPWPNPLRGVTIPTFNWPHQERDHDLKYCSFSDSDIIFTEIPLPRDDIAFQWNERPWLKSARSYAITQILQTRARFGYHLRTAYLSVIYLDQYLSRKWIPDDQLWHVRLLSIACLSLAAKMEETRPSLKSLSEYDIEGYSFPSYVVHKMELLVLDTLDWEMMYITPIAYVNYFVTKFCNQPRHQELVIRAAELIFAMIQGINLVDHLSSPVAAAAVLAAYNVHLTKTILDSKMNAVPFWGSVEKEQTISCYCLLKGILILKTPDRIISPNRLPNDDTSRRGSKRRLDF